MTLQAILQLTAGLALLIAGAEGLVRGAVRLAGRFGISPLVVGLTVVAFGTSSPELAVSVQSAWSGQPDVALGNVLGSNVFNVLVILGLSAAITPLAVSVRLIRIDVPLMIAASLAVALFAFDGAIGRLEGVLLVAGIAAYTLFQILQARQADGAESGGAAAARHAGGGRRRAALDLTLVAGGLALLVLGSGWLVEAAVAVARSLGVGELVIGLTLVAAGTSLPEVATSVVAAVRGERDIAVGNVVGSNVFNLLAVLGLTATLAPRPLAVATQALAFDLPVMVAVAFACLPIFFTGRSVSRWEGWTFLAYYAAYLAFLLLTHGASPALPLLRSAMLFFVLPLTALTLAVVSWREWRRSRG